MNLTKNFDVDYENLFKEIVWDSIVKLAIKKIFLALPKWLGSAFFSPIITYIVVEITDKIYEALKELVNLEVILFKNESAQKAFAKAHLSLKKIALEKGIESEEFKKEKEHAKETFAKLVRFDVG